MANLISAQEYRNEGIVSSKVAAGDFEVQVSPVFIIDGVEYQVVVDGHHSLEAARIAGVDPEFVVQTARDNDTIALLEIGNVEDFLAAHIVDGEYRFVETGNYVW